MADARALALLAALALASCAPTAETGPAPAPPPAAAVQPTVGGAAMDPGAAILDNLARSADHTTLVAAIRAAGLADRLTGGVTLFAPNNDAFARLPRGTMDALMAPENRRLLGEVLSYHVIGQPRTRADIAADARSGSSVYRTLQGGLLRFRAEGERLIAIDIHGNRSGVAIADVRNAGGIVHVVDQVLLPAT